MKGRCERAGIAFFHKQSAAFRTEIGIELDGQIVREYPRIALPEVRQLRAIANCFPSCGTARR